MKELIGKTVAEVIKDSPFETNELTIIFTDGTKFVIEVNEFEDEDEEGTLYIASTSLDFSFG